MLQIEYKRRHNARQGKKNNLPLVAKDYKVNIAQSYGSR
jgi:hypothetical protein